MYTSYLTDRLRGRANMARDTHPVDAELDDKAAGEIERLENDITAFIRDAHLAGYMAGVADSEDYDHDPTEMERYAFIEYMQKGDDDD